MGLISADLSRIGGDRESAQAGGITEAAPYDAEDFARVAKFDAHVHVNVDHPELPSLARECGFALLSINVDSPEFPSIADQRAVTIRLTRAEPTRMHWATTFSMAGFENPGWADRVNAELAEAKAEGARAVKIWKNIGMTERDADGRLITLDHPGLTPVIAQARDLELVVIGHQAEPQNCWMPLEQMTTDSDRRYFARRPQQHMHLRPELPSYDDLIAMRDRFLAAHSELRFVGAHLGSLEHDIDRLGAFLDRFPAATVDLSSRMSHVQRQSLRDRERVRDFFVHHQDRLLYGSDMTFNAHTDPVRFRRAAHAIWTSEWRYLATPGSQHIDTLGADVPGLALPRVVIDKIYLHNATRVFGIAEATSGSPRLGHNRSTRVDERGSL